MNNRQYNPFDIPEHQSEEIKSKETFEDFLYRLKNIDNIQYDKLANLYWKLKQKN